MMVDVKYSIINLYQS